MRSGQQEICEDLSSVRSGQQEMCDDLSSVRSGQQEMCDDLSSVRSGIVVMQSVAPGPMACRARWMRGHTISSLQRRPVREP